MGRLREGLRRFGEGTAFLRSLLSSPEARKRWAARPSKQKLQGIHPSIAEHATALFHPDGQKRQHAAISLYNVSLPAGEFAKALPVFSRALKHEHLSPSNAMLLLGKTRAAAALPFLAKYLHPESDHKNSALNVVKKIVEANDGRPLSQELEVGGVKKPLEGHLANLLLYEEEVDRDALEWGYTPHTVALNAASILGPQKSLQYLLRAFSSEDELQRKRAGSMIMRIDNEEVLRTFSSFLKTASDALVRHEAAVLISGYVEKHPQHSELAERLVGDELEQMLENASIPGQAVAPALALSRLGGSRRSRQLIDAYSRFANHDGSTLLKKTIIHGLGELGDAHAVDFLGGLAYYDPNMINEVAEALQKAMWKEPTAVRHLLDIAAFAPRSTAVIAENAVLNILSPQNRQFVDSLTGRHRLDLMRIHEQPFSAWNHENADTLAAGLRFASMSHQRDDVKKFAGQVLEQLLKEVDEQ